MALGACQKSGEPTQLDVSEEAILSLQRQLNVLKREAFELELPNLSRKFFAPEVKVVDLNGWESEEPVAVAPGLSITTDSGKLGSPDTSGELNLWPSLFDRFAYLEQAGFAVVDGHLEGQQLQAQVSFGGAGRLTNGDWASVEAKLTLQCIKNESGEWLISSWQTESMKIQAVPRPFFTDVIADVIEEPNTLVRLLDSPVKRYLTYAAENYKGQKLEESARGMYTAMSVLFSGVSVVDIDADGWDDLFFAPTTGQALLLRNVGGTHFVDVAPERGLNLKGPVTCTLFVDLDNDGDLDLATGGRQRFALYENRDGAFHTLESPEAFGIISISAADVNADGLLDLYLSTRKRGTGRPGAASDTPKILSRVADPNLLLLNSGQNRFEVAGKEWNVDGGGPSFHAMWSDFDRDGDPDVYVSNDFSANQLLRNDGGKFVDIASEVGVEDLGFGMGCNWGDYDNDGRVDLYTTNMYSKAGKRVTKVDQRFAVGARGNSLFHNNGQGFQRVSGDEPGQSPVHRAGWSWGSQFVDLNSDGLLDIHARSGFYTPDPKLGSLDDL